MKNYNTEDTNNLRSNRTYTQRAGTFNRCSHSIIGVDLELCLLWLLFLRRIRQEAVSKKQTPTQGKVSRGQPHWDEETNIDKGSKQYKQCHTLCAAIPEHHKYTSIHCIHCNPKYKNTTPPPPPNQYALSNKNESCLLVKTREVKNPEKHPCWLSCLI